MLAAKTNNVEAVEELLERNAVISGNCAFEEMIYNSNIITGTGVCDCIYVTKPN